MIPITRRLILKGLLGWTALATVGSLVIKVVAGQPQPSSTFSYTKECGCRFGLLRDPLGTKYWVLCCADPRHTVADRLALLARLAARRERESL